MHEQGGQSLTFGDKLTITLYAEGKSMQNSLTYHIVSDKETKDMILNDFKNGYIQNLNINDPSRYKYNFTDEMIDNSVIVKMVRQNQTMINVLYVFKTDRKSFEEYTLLYPDGNLKEFVIGKDAYNNYYLVQ